MQVVVPEILVAKQCLSLSVRKVCADQEPYRKLGIKVNETSLVCHAECGHVLNTAEVFQNALSRLNRPGESMSFSMCVACADEEPYRRLGIKVNETPLVCPTECRHVLDTAEVFWKIYLEVSHLSPYLSHAIMLMME